MVSLAGHGFGGRMVRARTDRAPDSGAKMRGEAGYGYAQHREAVPLYNIGGGRVPSSHRNKVSAQDRPGGPPADAQRQAVRRPTEGKVEVEDSADGRPRRFSM